MARRGPTRVDLTIAAFERAGRRGLTRPELQRVAGGRYQRVLRELEDAGFLVCEKPSRFDHTKTWRWTVIAPIAPTEPVDEPPAPSAEQLRLPVIRPDGTNR